MGSFTKLVTTILLVLLGCLICQGQVVLEEASNNQIVFSLEIHSMRLVRFERTISLGFGENQILYDEAVVLELSAYSDEFASENGMNIMPLLFIGNHAYAYMKADHVSEREKRLVFHLHDYLELEDGMPISYSFEHANPHQNQEGLLTYDPSLIER